MRRRLAVAAGLVAAVLLSGGCGAVSSVRAAGDEARLCAADVLFIGARGSGEHPDDAQERMGPAVFDTYQRLSDIVSGRLTLAADPVDYPAQDVWGAGATGGSLYDSSYQVGRSWVAAQLAEHAVRCPQQRFVLSGYSQGAHVVGDAVMALDHSNRLDAEVLARLAGVALFGDPRYNPTDDVDVDSAARTRSGIFAYPPYRNGGVRSLRPRFQSSLTSAVHSYCRTSDAICNYHHLSGLVRCARDCPHFHYPQGDTRDAAVWLARRLLSSPPASPLVSPSRPPSPAHTTAPRAAAIPLCRDWEQLDENEADAALRRMMAAHHDTTDLGSVRLSVGFYCRLYPGRHIDGVYHG